MPKVLPSKDISPPSSSDPRHTIFCYALLSLAAPADAVVAFGVRLISDKLTTNVPEARR